MVFVSSPGLVRDGTSYKGVGKTEIITGEKIKTRNCNFWQLFSRTGTLDRIKLSRKSGTWILLHFGLELR